MVITLTAVKMPEKPARATPTIHRSPPDAGGVDGFGEGGVGEPAPVGGARRGEEARGHGDAAAQEQPVGEGVEPGEGHVGRADLQRHQVVGHAEPERAEEQEQHDAAVHGEELVVGLQAHEVVVGHRQLDPHEHRHGAGDQEHDEARHHVVEADLLVVGTGQVGEEPLALRPGDDLDQAAFRGLVLRGPLLEQGHRDLLTLPKPSCSGRGGWASHVLNVPFATTWNQNRMKGW